MPNFAELSERLSDRNAVLSDRIAALTARVAELEAALRGIVAEAGPQYGKNDYPGTINTMSRIARAALKGSQP